MDYEGLVRDKLGSAGASVGSVVMAHVPKGSYRGLVMPHHGSSGRDVLTLKLDSGYNVGLRMADESRVDLLEEGERMRGEVKMTIPFDEGKPTVAVLGTGGTIASYVDYRTGAVHPAESAEDIVRSVPEVAKFCNVRARVLFSILSEDMHVDHWQALARAVAEELNTGARGVVVAHGTDTMGYTAAALSFMLKDLSGPVVLVGSQRSSDRPSSDSHLNLLSAVQLAAESDLGEVVIVMHGDESDEACAIHPGTRARKMHTSRRDAFETINSEPFGRIEGGSITLREGYRRASEGKVGVEDDMTEDVAIQYCYPGLTAEHLLMVSEHCGGLVLAGTGLGHVGSKLKPVIRDIIGRGVKVVMTSQCINGTVNMNVYSSGRDLLEEGVIPGGDMLPETAYVKLMWVLAHKKGVEDVARLMQENLVGELGDRRTL